MSIEAKSSNSHIHIGCRLLVLLCVGAGIVTLVGLAFTGIEYFFMGGLKHNVEQLKQETANLEAQNIRYKHNIHLLNKQLNNLTTINRNLKGQVQLFSAQNERLEQTCQNLNESDVQLSLQVETLEGMNSGLAYQVNKFQNETDNLTDSVQHLQQLSEHLQSELTDFQQLKSGIHTVAADDGNDFAQVIKVTQDLLSNETAIAFQNQLTVMMNVAMHIEFSDNAEGYNQVEFDDCIDHFSYIVQIPISTLNQHFQFTEFKGLDGVVTYTQMLVIIKDIISLAKQPWLHHNTLYYVFA